MNPLDQLADISTPQTVSIWPLAWGYWVLIVTGLFLIISLFVLWRRYRAHYAAKKLALSQLNRIDASDTYFAHKVQLTIRQFVKSYHPRESIINLSGDEFQNRLLTIANGYSNDNERHTEMNTALSDLYLYLYAPNTQSTKDEREADADRIISSVRYFIELTTPSFWKKKKYQKISSTTMGDKAHV